MLFVIEKNMFYANDQMHFIDALKKLEKKYLLVDYIPFVHTIEPLPKVNVDVIAFGSTNMIKSMMKNSIQKNWVYTSNEFSNQLLINRWKEHMLNQGYVTTLENVSFEDRMFIRPILDLKDFAGQIVNSIHLNEWKKSVKEYSEFNGENTVTDNTLVIVSVPQEIIAEYRMFVVDNKIVAWSQYRKDGQLIYTNNVPNSVLEFATQRIYNQNDFPRGYVIDIADTPAGYKIIELNCLNSAGLYDCNVENIILALDVC